MYQEQSKFKKGRKEGTTISSIKTYNKACKLVK